MKIVVGIVTVHVVVVTLVVVVASVRSAAIVVALIVLFIHVRGTRLSERVMSGVVGLDGNVVVRMVGLSGCVTDGGGLCGNVVVVVAMRVNTMVVVVVAVVVIVLLVRPQGRSPHCRSRA